MKISILIATFLIFCSCIAIVDERAEGRKVKSFIISKDEAESLIEQVEDKSSEEKTEIFNFKDKN
jgi:hypothetical protein